MDFRKDREIIKNRHAKVIQKLQDEFQKRPLKVVFLNSENAKWAYQSLYEELAHNPRFDVLVLVTITRNLLQAEYAFIEYEKLARDSYARFKENGINVAYAFDFKNKKYIDLKAFEPDIIFYEQPWEISETQSIKETSKYALAFYCHYGTCITNGENLLMPEFYRDLSAYFVDNDDVIKDLLEHGCQKEQLVLCGQPKLDAYLKPVNPSNIGWKSKNKKRVIYAPHHSFSEKSVLKLGTFDWNYAFFLDLATKNPDIEFILKPHPELKRQIVEQKLMSIDEMTRYFKMWENLQNAQINEYNNYFDMFRTSDLLITDCNSFLYEYLPSKKPVIHLIGRHSVGHNEYGQKIIAGYYPARNMDELQSQLDLVLFKGEDPLLTVREKIIEHDLIQPKEGVARFIENYMSTLLTGLSSSPLTKTSPGKSEDK